MTADPVVRLRNATMRYDDRVVFDALDLDIAPGEFLAVLGPNGAGKTTLLKVLLGHARLASGSVTVAANEIGYVPQQHAFDRDFPLRGRDLVRLGLDGQKPGLPWTSRSTRARVDRALEAVGALPYGRSPVGRLSGGEQQRLRIAQALVTEPELLLCDEPLLSLDLAQQASVSALIDDRRRSANTAVVFVTHEINPVQPYVDRVLYLVGGRWAVGTPEAVLTSERLSELYGTDIEVLHLRGRTIVVGSDDNHHHV
ncbi:MAG TPA: metal ABC transporter ATP-binding protein [Acidimicrobiia bacterium]|jgi:zinc/manganese transport system ATP-binding protein|nr:metal ABC transporter ATP-binding protein [Acidimicrobiia bacterium]